MLKSTGHVLECIHTLSITILQNRNTIFIRSDAITCRDCTYVVITAADGAETAEGDEDCMVSRKTW